VGIGPLKTQNKVLHQQLNYSCTFPKLFYSETTDYRNTPAKSTLHNARQLQVLMILCQPFFNPCWDGRVSSPNWVPSIPNSPQNCPLETLKTQAIPQFLVVNVML